MARGRAPAVALAPRRLAAALALLAAAACARHRERLVLGDIALPALGLLYIGAAQGYFAEEGLDLDLRTFPTGKDALSSLRAGGIEAAVAFETPVATRAFEWSDLRVLTTLHASDRNTFVVARVDRGIRAASDLRGRRIGVPRGTSAEFLLRTILAFNGIGPPEVTVEDVPAPELAEALASGRVDAVAIWQPYADAAVAAAGVDGALEIPSDVYTEMSMVVTTERRLSERREAFLRLVGGLARAERLVSADPEAAFAALRGRFPSEDASRLRAQWSAIRPQLGLQNLLVTVLEREAEWLHASGRVSGPAPDFRRVLAPQILDAVEPDAVTFIAR